jgi:hypothetical protein
LLRLGHKWRIVEQKVALEEGKEYGLALFFVEEDKQKFKF